MTADAGASELLPASHWGNFERTFAEQEPEAAAALRELRRHGATPHG